MVMQLAIRTFKRAKQYYLTTVFTLAITLSMVLTVFSLVDLVFFAPLPYNSAENLYVLQGGLKTEQSEFSGVTNIHVTNYIKANNDIFSEFAVYHEWTDYKLYDIHERPTIKVLLGSDNLFEVLGVKPVLGRLFNQNEAVGNKQPSVVLGYRTWQTHYQGDQDIIGKKIQLNQRRFTVIGIAPDNLVLPYYQNINDSVWIPLDMDEVFDVKGCINCYMGNFKAAVRLKEGANPKGIATSLNELALKGAELHTPELLKDYIPTASIIEFRQAIQGDSTLIILMLSVGVLLLMAIALINLSSMQLARAVAKIKSVAISFAFGASNKQLFVESLKHNLVVIGLAVLIALLLTGASFSIVQILASNAIARLDSLSLSLNTVLFALLLTFLIALLYSALELKVVNEKNLMASLQSSGKGVGKQMSAGTSHLLIGLQVTFSFLVLMATCHVVLLTLSEALRSNGITTENKWSVVIDYSQIKDNPERINHHKSFLIQLSKLQSVTNVQAISESLFPLNHNHDLVYNEQGNYLGSALRPRISKGYLDSLGLDIIGNGFVAGDDELENYPVIINQRLADKISDDTKGIIGQKISFDNKKFYTVKGVASNISFPGNDSLEYIKAYIPAKYNGERNYSYLVTADNNNFTVDGIRALVTKIDSRLDILSADTLAYKFSQVRQKHLSAAWVAIVLAVVSLLMVCVGINGIVNYMVQVRRYDLGVKLAMGADNSRLLKDSLLELMQPVLMSLLFAFSLSFMLLGYSRTLPSVSFTPDWFIVATLTLGFAMLSLLVSFIPISKVLSNDPISALRSE
ncbi:ABC transporter permease [Colwellia asteriadis]|uniref:ABC transporter permease n=1 Tax=Colwellia asteriadis TaxID=517723 RepID=A0ABN1L3E9_9GAMM